MYGMVPVPWFESLQPVQSGNDLFVNLRSARVNLRGDRVAQLAFNLVLGHVSVSAVNLNGVEATGDAGLADIQLRHRGLAHGMASLGFQPRCLVQDEAG